MTYNRDDQVGVANLAAGDAVGMRGERRWHEVNVSRTTGKQIIIGERRFRRDDGREIKAGWGRACIASLDHVLDGESGLTVRQRLVEQKREQEYEASFNLAVNKIKGTMLRRLELTTLLNIVSLIEADEDGREARLAKERQNERDGK